MPTNNNNIDEDRSRTTIIIATAGSLSRKKSLMDAVRSLERQAPQRPRILIVFNGPSVSAEVVDCVSSRNSVKVEKIEQAGLPNALNFGRRCVTTPYFGFLDDDDIYLPNALAVRCQVLDANPGMDVVATNGYVQSRFGKTKLLPENMEVASEPLAELLRQNWLASCGGLFRTATVDESYFPLNSKYFEWTMTAFLLSLDRKLAYVEEPTFVIRETEGSLSTSDEYVDAYPRILRRMLDYEVGRDVRAEIRQRLAKALHAASVRKIERGRRAEAWTYHLQSLFCDRGLKYLAYTRKLII